MNRRKTWSWSTGYRGNTVRVFEREPGGVIYLAAFDPTLAKGRGGYRRRSLEHRDREAARAEAMRVSATLADGRTLSTNPTLGYILDLYRHHELDTKAPATAKWLRANLSCWETYLGREFRVADISLREWEGFKRDRLTGAITAAGAAAVVSEGSAEGKSRDKSREKLRRAVTPGTVNLCLDALTIALNWACRWRVQNRPLLDRSPVWRFAYLDDVNPTRAIWTHDRFLTLLATADSLTMQVEWEGKRQQVPCFLGDILAISEGTGRRIGAVRQLRAEDIRLGDGGGRIRWPRDTDKGGKEWLTPVSPAVRERLVKILRNRPALGPAPLFPAPRNASEPVGRDTLALFLRRKFVTERKHLADVDVAKAGGWRSITTMKRSYQQADDAGVLEAVLDPRRLLDRQG